VGSLTPNPKKRDYLLPPGCKDLVDVLQDAPETPSPTPPRVNSSIQAREVRVIGEDGERLGIFSLADALKLARSLGVDLVEIAPTALPPVCRVMDFGKYRYEELRRAKKKP
jgi:translation initiation factor IF-3